MRNIEIRLIAFSALVFAGALLLGATAVSAQEGTRVVPVRVVDGHIMAVGYLTNSTGDVSDISLEISFEEPGVFLLESNPEGPTPNYYEWLANPPIVKLLLKPDLQFEFPAAEVKPDDRSERKQMHEKLTRIHSNKLDEHKVKGILGAGFLRKYTVALDLAAGTLTLSPLGTPVNGDVITTFNLNKGRVFIPMEYADGNKADLMLGGDAYDTYIDSAAAKAAGKPAGDLSPVWLGGAQGGIDLSSRVALRPGARRSATVVGGVNLFEGMRVELDWNESRVAFTPTRPPQFPVADLAYFKAEAEGTAAALQSYLEQHPSGRLSPEAATRLMANLMKQKDASDEQLLQGLKWVAETSLPERRMENSIVVVREFRLMPGREALVARAGTFALQYSRNAITVQDTYRLHNIIGDAYLRQDKLEEAWKHFLSAAFMPLDNKTDRVHNIEVNYNLARTYDLMGRNTRAYSRYLRTRELMEPLAAQVEAMPEDISDQPPESQRLIRLLKGAIAETTSALERLRKQIPAEALEMLEG